MSSLVMGPTYRAPGAAQSVDVNLRQGCGDMHPFSKAVEGQRVTTRNFPHQTPAKSYRWFDRVEERSSRHAPARRQGAPCRTNHPSHLRPALGSRTRRSSTLATWQSYFAFLTEPFLDGGRRRRGRNTSSSKADPSGISGAMSMNGSTITGEECWDRNPALTNESTNRRVTSPLRSLRERGGYLLSLRRASLVSSSIKHRTLFLTPERLEASD